MTPTTPPPSLRYSDLFLYIYQGHFVSGVWQTLPNVCIFIGVDLFYLWFYFPGAIHIMNRFWGSRFKKLSGVNYCHYLLRVTVLDFSCLFH